MTIGRSAPRYERMALLYPRSKYLQSSLCEFFIVVVCLCHQMLKFTQKSTLGRFGASLKDSDLANYQSELDKWASAIKDEVNFLMAKKIEKQAVVTSQVWIATSRMSRHLTHDRQMKAFIRALDFCSTYDYMSPWKQTRKSGNTSLFRQCLEYVEWRDQLDSCTLILTGKLGSGKSVLMANVVDDLNLHFQGKHIPVAFFFRRHDLPESLKARTIFGSLARQLLRPTPRLTEVVESRGLLMELDHFELMRHLLSRVLSPDVKVCLVLDGLDECASTERTIVMEELGKLQDT